MWKILSIVFYTIFASKLYSNVYLFQKNVPSLTFQKNRRECEILCKESIFRSHSKKGTPVENILKSYLDETTDEDLIEKVEEIIIEEPDNNPAAILDGEVNDKETETKTGKNNETMGEIPQKDDYKKALTEAVDNMRINKIEEEKPKNEDLQNKSGENDIPTIEGLTNMNDERKSSLSKNNDVTIKVEVNNNTSNNDVKKNL